LPLRRTCRDQHLAGRATRQRYRIAFVSLRSRRPDRSRDALVGPACPRAMEARSKGGSQ
jgi:hypothetical protein